MKKEYELGALVEPLCLWYEKNKRSMPWRDDATPYHVWLSEIMLQQTRIEAVKAYYAKFTKRLPNIKDLADVSEEELLKMWEGLGYYNRARNLQKAAKVVVEEHDGKLPADYDLLLSLPGIGNYTAGAIASIAYGIPAPAVDGNVLRVTMRYLNCRDDITKMSVRKNMEQSIMKVIPKENPGDFNQALMELGEVICIPNGKPLCEKCPLAATCGAKKAGAQEELPIKPEKKGRRIEKRTILILEKEGKIAIRKRPEKGLLAGLWEFPSWEGYVSQKKMKEEFPNAKIKPLEAGKHIFSHVEWHMKGYRVSIEEALPSQLENDLLWVKKQELHDIYSIPVAFHSFLHQI